MVEILKKFKKKLTPKQKLFVFFLVVLFCLFLVLQHLNKNVNPIIISVSEAKVRMLSIVAVNNAIGEVINGQVVYDNLVNIEQDQQGNVTLIQANAFEINKLNRKLMMETQNQLENIGDSGVGIPLGSFSGLPVLNGLGPRINIKLLPVGSINCTFSSEFRSAGINQTNHKIYVNMETRVSLVLPLATKTITTVTQILICESIIVGKVPEVYLSTSSLDEALNLVPDRLK